MQPPPKNEHLPDIMSYVPQEATPFQKKNSMSMKTKAAVLVSSFAVLLFVVVGSLGLGGVHASTGDGSYRQMQVYSEVLSRVQSEYVEEPNIPKVTDGALHGLLESLDANSSYLTPAAYKALQGSQSRSQGRDRCDCLEALRIRRRSFGAARFARGQSRHRGYRHLRIDRRAEHARHVTA